MRKTDEIVVIEKELVNKISEIPDTNFMWCVNHYFESYRTKAEFEKSRFFDEFRYDGNLTDLLRRYFSLCSFANFFRNLRKISEEIIDKRIGSDETSFQMLSWLTEYFSVNALRKMCESEPNRRVTFMYLFKVLEPFFLYSRSNRPTSTYLYSRARQIYKKYAVVPDEKILEVLEDPSSATDANVDDDWMIDHILSSI